MTRYLLDANAIIVLLSDTTSNAARRVRREQPNDVAISAIVAHELFYGAFKSRRGAQNVALIDALQFVVLEFDKEDARQAGAIRALLASKGTPIAPYDVLIAGQAVARNLILVTHNTQEFRRVPGLRFEDWQTKTQGYRRDDLGSVARACGYSRSRFGGITDKLQN